MNDMYDEYPAAIFECKENDELSMKVVFFGISDTKLYHEIACLDEASYVLHELLSHYDSPPMPMSTIAIDLDEIATERKITNIFSSRILLIKPSSKEDPIWENTDTSESV